MAFEQPHMYNDGTDSTVGSNIYVTKYDKKALIEATKKQYFGQLSGVRNQPKHFGKSITKFHYIPILDDRNLGDQGIDATGVVTGSTVYVVENNPLSSVQNNIYEVFNTSAEASAYINAIGQDPEGNMICVERQVDNKGHQQNLYGSSKDVGTISGKLPGLSEEGGRVNRVGMTRVQITSNLEKFGFFTEYTQESMDFDNDDQLKSHMYREVGRAAGEITEDKLAIDLYYGAGVVMYPGGASSLDTVAAGGAALDSFVTYSMLRKMDKELTANYCPKDTKLIKGSRLIDTKTVSAARYAYISDDVRMLLEDMTDNFGNQAWIPVRQYAAAGTIAMGETGAIDTTRFIEVPEMIREESKGGVVAPNVDGVASTDGVNADVHPILFVGSGAFTQVGFQTDGKSVKFKIKSKTPDDNTDRNDPYGEVGFYSIKWYYGILIERPEWIGKILTAVKA